MGVGECLCTLADAEIGIVFTFHSILCIKVAFYRLGVAIDRLSFGHYHC